LGNRIVKNSAKDKGREKGPTPLARECNREKIQKRGEAQCRWNENAGEKQPGLRFLSRNKARVENIGRKHATKEKEHRSLKQNRGRKKKKTPRQTGVEP